MLKEFKTFVLRGNIVDLAIGIIVGGAFNKIVSSLVNDIIMPFFGIIIGGIDFTTLNIIVKDATINYGLFLQNIVDFLIVAACIFFIVKSINKIHEALHAKKEEEKKKEPKIETELDILKDIRKELKKQNNKKSN